MTTEKKPKPVTAVLPNGEFNASYDSYVQSSSAVFRLKFRSKNPPLRQALNL